MSIARLLAFAFFVATTLAVACASESPATVAAPPLTAQAGGACSDAGTCWYTLDGGRAQGVCVPDGGCAPPAPAAVPCNPDAGVDCVATPWVCYAPSPNDPPGNGWGGVTSWGTCPITTCGYGWPQSPTQAVMCDEGMIVLCSACGQQCFATSMPDGCEPGATAAPDGGWDGDAGAPGEPQDPLANICCPFGGP